VGDGTAPPAATERDVVIDLLRASATTTVVLWHWVFTIIVWRSDGPHADNPIGYVSGLWSLTWVLQVLPLFFFAGGYTHAQAWTRRRHSANAWRRFTARRAAQLVIPALVLIAVVVGAAVVIATLRTGADPWMARATTLVLSPLWFLAVYLLLVATVPLWDRLHRAWGELVPIGLAALAMGVDVLRFRYGYEQLALANLVFVWAACHQVGWSWDRLRVAPRRFGHVLVLVGLAALVGLTNMGLYPRSMVGTTSALDRFSNMGPPTLPIVALLVLQVGLVVTYRERLAAWAVRPAVARRVDWLSRNAMPVFLWHSVGFATFFVAMRAVWTVPDSPSALWWVTRPVWLVGPALCTLPLMALSARLHPGMRVVTEPARRSDPTPAAEPA
jgi:peptidoglycan/LPS O-acetylase OafA/YrhL